MDSSEFRKAAHAAIEEIIDYYDTIRDRRVVSNVSPGYLQELVPSEPPQQGEKWADIQKDIESKIMPGLTHWQSPNFMAFFPANATYPSMLGELYSAAFTAPAFNWLCSPAVTELETIVLDWLAQLLSLPTCFLSKGEGGGVIQGSASEAIVTVMIAAREKYINRACEELSGDVRKEKTSAIRSRLVAIGSDQTHSSTAKAALILGVHYKEVSTSMDSNLSMTGQQLLATLQECEREGLLPFYLTATLGTTSTCAIDSFAEIAQVCRGNVQSADIWIHVDAAYAGAALACEEYQHITKDLGTFDSFEMNMSKWLLTNFDAGCLWVKRRKDLTSALSITPSYLRNDVSDSGLVTDYRDWQIPLGRRFRSLKIWFVLRTYGVSGLKAYIRNHIRLGKMFHDWVLSRPDLFKVLTPPAFALTVLNVKAESNPLNTNNVTKRVCESINAAGEITLTGELNKGVYAIRVISANPQTDEQHLRKAFEILVRTAQDVRRQEIQEPSTFPVIGKARL